MKNNIFTKEETNLISIYLIRHGEAASSWDQDRDPGLSLRGKEQANSLSDRLNQEEDLDSCNIISSPLLRAQQTAEPFSKKRNIKIYTDTSFSEIPSPGISLAARKEWLTKIFSIKKADLGPHQENWIKQIIKSIKEQEKTTLIFSHFMVINSIVSHIQKNKELVVFKPDYCSVTKIILENSSISLKLKGKELPTTIN